MDICRLKPDYNTCCSCIDIQLDTGEKKDCNDCPEHSWVRLIHLGRTIFGKDYAYVYGPITDWKIVRVDSGRLGITGRKLIEFVYKIDALMKLNESLPTKDGDT